MPNNYIPAILHAEAASNVDEKELEKEDPENASEIIEANKVGGEQPK